MKRKKKGKTRDKTGRPVGKQFVDLEIELAHGTEALCFAVIDRPCALRLTACHFEFNFNIYMHTPE